MSFSVKLSFQLNYIEEQNNKYNIMKIYGIIYGGANCTPSFIYEKGYMQ